MTCLQQAKAWSWAFAGSGLAPNPDETTVCSRGMPSVSGSSGVMLYSLIMGIDKSSCGKGSLQPYRGGMLDFPLQLAQDHLGFQCIPIARRMSSILKPCPASIRGMPTRFRFRLSRQFASIASGIRARKPAQRSATKVIARTPATNYS